MRSSSSRMFLSATETEKLDANDVTEMIKTWSGKEALYKLAGRKGIHFAEELTLTKISEEEWVGEINCGNVRKKVNLSITRRHDFVVSVNPKAAVDV